MGKLERGWGVGKFVESGHKYASSIVIREFSFLLLLLLPHFLKITQRTVFAVSQMHEICFSLESYITYFQLLLLL